MNYAIILAGGKGKRLNSEVPKQFLPVAGRPLICFAIDPILKSNCFKRVTIVCNAAYRNLLENTLTTHFSADNIEIVPGGDGFLESAFIGFDSIAQNLRDDDIILYHYAVSPFVSTDMIEDNIRICKQNGNAISASPYVQLCCKLNSLKTWEYLDRNNIMVLNTPQSFRASLLKTLKEKYELLAIDNVDEHLTTILLKSGMKPFFSSGKQVNIKVTTSEDLEFVRNFFER